MHEPAKLYLLCGRTGSGKTTFARGLERDHEGVRFTVDEWMIRLFGHHVPRDVFDARLAVCKDLISEVAERLLESGVGGVLDFGFWSREERERTRQRFEKAAAEIVLVYLRVPEEVLRERLTRRNRDLPAGSYEITEDMARQFSSQFEPPLQDEGPWVLDAEPRQDAAAPLMPRSGTRANGSGT